MKLVTSNEHCLDGNKGSIFELRIKTQTDENLEVGNCFANQLLFYIKHDCIFMTSNTNINLF